MSGFKGLVERLTAEQTEFIIVGGFAATIHGATRSTQDLDVVYRQSPENVQRLIRALEPYAPYPRGAPPGLPFKWNRQTIEFGANFTLRTSLGFIDLLEDITGGGTYGQLLPYTIPITVYGRECLCLDLPKLIQVKHAAGRPKDFDVIAELQALADERGKLGSVQNEKKDHGH